jgi:phosphoglycerate dehydrogenase-like enzyme
MIFRSIVILIVLATALGAQTKKILVYRQSPEIVRALTAASPRARIVAVEADSVLEEIADADAFVGTIKPEWVRAGKNLQWVQSRSAGVESVLHLSGGNDLRDSDIILTNNQIVQGPEIADHAMAMLLAMTRDLPRYLRQQSAEEWKSTPLNVFELNKKTALVIGMGGIGTQIAIRAWAHGMTVVGVDPEDMPMTPYVDRVVKPDQMADILPLADVVFMTAPYTQASYRMVGASEFELMKKGSWFIAVSRGGTYDLNALVKALDSKKLAGAGVDVTDPEPLPANHPLWKFDNVIITPHMAGRSDVDQSRMIGLIQENIRRFVDGEPLLNVVDKQKGY